MEAANRGAQRGRRAVGRARHRAAVRAGHERLRRPRRQLPLLLRPQDDVREVRRGLRRAARRLRHVRRAVRGADAGADAQGHRVPDRAGRHATTGRACSTGCAAPVLDARHDHARPTSSCCRSSTPPRRPCDRARARRASCARRRRRRPPRRGRAGGRSRPPTGVGAGDAPRAGVPPRGVPLRLRGRVLAPGPAGRHGRRQPHAGLVLRRRPGSTTRRADEAVARAVDEGADIVDLGGVRAGRGPRGRGRRGDRPRAARSSSGCGARHPDLLVSVDTWRAEVARGGRRRGRRPGQRHLGGARPGAGRGRGRARARASSARTPAARRPRTDPFRVDVPAPRRRRPTRSTACVDDVVAHGVGRGARGPSRSASTPRACSSTRRTTSARTRGTRCTWSGAPRRSSRSGFPVLMALSRKDFVGETLDLPAEERLEGTLAATAVAAWLGAPGVPGARRARDPADPRHGRGHPRGPSPGPGGPGAGVSEVQRGRGAAPRTARPTVAGPWAWTASRPWWVQVLAVYAAARLFTRGRVPRGWRSVQDAEPVDRRAPGRTSRTSGFMCDGSWYRHDRRERVPGRAAARARTGWSSRTPGRSSRSSRCSRAGSWSSRGGPWDVVAPAARARARRGRGRSSSTGRVVRGAPRAVAARPGPPAGDGRPGQRVPDRGRAAGRLHRVARPAARRERAAAARPARLRLGGARRRRARVHAGGRAADGRRSSWCTPRCAGGRARRGTDTLGPGARACGLAGAGALAVGRLGLRCGPPICGWVDRACRTAYLQTQEAWRGVREVAPFGGWVVRAAVLVRRRGRRWWWSLASRS